MAIHLSQILVLYRMTWSAPWNYRCKTPTTLHSMPPCSKLSTWSYAIFGIEFHSWLLKYYMNYCFKVIGGIIERSASWFLSLLSGSIQHAGKSSQNKEHWANWTDFYMSVVSVQVLMALHGQGHVQCLSVMLFLLLFVVICKTPRH